MTTFITDEELAKLKGRAETDGLGFEDDADPERVLALIARLASAEAALKPLVMVAELDRRLVPGESTMINVNIARAAADHFAKVSRKGPDHGTD